MTGKEFYEFILTEAVDLNEPDTLIPIPENVLKDFIHYAKKNGFVPATETAITEVVTEIVEQKEKPKLAQEKTNFHYNLYELPHGGAKTRYKWNVAVIRTLKQIMPFILHLRLQAVSIVS